MEIKTLKDLKEWISEAEQKFGTDNANINFFTNDSFNTVGIETKIYKNEISYNTQSNSVNMNIYINGYDYKEGEKIELQTKITTRK